MKKLVIILLALPLVLGSCGMSHGNFNKQKFTRLKQIEPTYADTEDVSEEDPNDTDVHEEPTQTNTADFYPNEEVIEVEETETTVEPTVDEIEIIDLDDNVAEGEEEIIFSNDSDYEEVDRSEELNEPFRDKEDKEDFQKSRTIGSWLMVLSVLVGIIGVLLTILFWSETMFYASAILAALIIAGAFYFFVRAIFQNPNSGFKNKRMTGLAFGILWLGGVLGSIGWYLAAEVTALAGLGLTFFWIGIGAIVAFAVLMIIASRVAPKGE